MIQPGRLEVDRANTTSLQDAKSATSRTELCSYLVLSNVYRRFICNFKNLPHSFNNLLRKGEPDLFELDEEHFCSFHVSFEAMYSLPVLALPQRRIPYSFDTDACDNGIDCSLFQTHPGGEQKPLRFLSCSFSNAKRNYSTPEGECHAVV